MEKIPQACLAKSTPFYVVLHPVFNLRFACFLHRVYIRCEKNIFPLFVCNYIFLPLHPQNYMGELFFVSN